MIETVIIVETHHSDVSKRAKLGIYEFYYRTCQLEHVLVLLFMFFLQLYYLVVFCKSLL